MIVSGSLIFGTAVSPPVLTVGQLTALIRNTLETRFGEVWVEGEISNLRTAGSGHIYCTLKDETSQIRAVIFRSSALRLRFTLGEGMQVIARGRLAVYEPRGEYQIVVQMLEPKGIGSLQLAFEQLKERLTAEGIFDPARKRPLPRYPRTIGLITSLSGAAIRDILAVSHRRWPTMHIIIMPVPVQGQEAAAQIAAAVNCLNEEGQAEVIIVGRGGGSIEDLWCFNEEAVVRAVAGSRIPVVAAVGHEIDVTLTDFAADVRAPTPSAAAEIVVPVLDDIVQRLRDLTVRMGAILNRHTRTELRRLESERRGLLQFRYCAQREAQRIDALTSRLSEAVFSRLSVQHARRLRSDRDLDKVSPLITVQRGLATMPQYGKRLERQIRVIALQRRQQVQAALGRLNSVSPLAILARGYSILARVPGGEVIKYAGDMQAGDELTARLGDGRLHCAVKRVVIDTPAV